MRASAAVILGLLPCLFAVDADRDFAGTWIVDKSAGIRRPLPIAIDERLTVIQDELALQCASPRTQGPGSQWSYLLDGTETRSRIGEETRNSSAKWEGSA